MASAKLARASSLSDHRRLRLSRVDPKDEPRSDVEIEERYSPFVTRVDPRFTPWLRHLLPVLAGVRTHLLMRFRGAGRSGVAAAPVCEQA